MDGVVTILEQNYYQIVRQIWQELEFNCGLRGIRVMPVPHFSWHVAGSYQEARIHEVLAEVCEHSQPFVVKTAGLGIFTAPKPVLYVALVKDRALMNFHEMLWEKIGELADQPNSYYNPDTWVPHITLAYEDFNHPEVGCVFEWLLHRPFTWEIQVNNLALIGQAETAGGDHITGGVCFQRTFQGRE